MKQVIFLTVNHCGPLPLRELHSTDETIVWRDPGGSWACLRPVSDYEWIHPSRGWRWHKHNYMYLPSLWNGSFFLWWITAAPAGIWACLRPFHDYEWFQPARGCTWHIHHFTYRVFVKQATWSSSFFLPWISAGREGWGYPTISDYQWLSHKHMAYKWIK